MPKLIDSFSNWNSIVIGGLEYVEMLRMYVKWWRKELFTYLFGPNAIITRYDSYVIHGLGSHTKQRESNRKT